MINSQKTLNLFKKGVSFILLYMLAFGFCSMRVGAQCCGGGAPPGCKDEKQIVSYYCQVGVHESSNHIRVTKTYKGQTQTLYQLDEPEVQLPGKTSDSRTLAGTFECEVGSVIKITASTRYWQHYLAVGLSVVPDCNNSETVEDSDWKHFIQPGESISAEITVPGSVKDSQNAGAGRICLGSLEVALGLGSAQMRLVGSNEENPGGYGHIGLYQETLLMSSYTPAILYSNVDVSKEGVERITNASGLKQILTPVCLAHVETLSADSFEIRYFYPNQVGAKDEGLETYSIVGGNTVANSFVTWRFSNPGFNAEGKPRLEMREIRGEHENVSIFTDYSDGSWSQSNSDRIEKKIYISGVGSGNYTLRKEVRNSSNVLITESEDTYVSNRLISHLDGPATGGVLTTYSYDNSGRMVSMQRSDGYWESYIVDGEVLSPIGDLPLTGDMSLARRVAKSPYYSGLERTYIGSTQIGKSLQTNYADSDEHGNPAIMSYKIMYLDEDTAGSWTYKSTYTYDAESYLKGRLYREFDSSTGIQQIYAYEKGEIDGSGNFTAGGANSHLKMMVTNQVYINSTFTIIPSVSKRVIAIYNKKNQVVVLDDYICTAAETFAFTTRTLRSYDANGNMTQELRDGRVVYEASFDEFSRLIWEVDANGTRTEFSNYDFSNHAQTVIKKGFAGSGSYAPVQPDQVTTYDYDAEGRLISEIKWSGTSSILTHLWEYDTAGRLKKETINGVATNYTYSADPNSGKIETKTLPGGITEITHYYRDGRIKSISGSGVVARVYTYGIQDQSEEDYANLLWRKEEKGSTIPGTVGNIWEKTIMDWLGRTRLAQVKAPQTTGNATLRKEFEYTSLGGLWKVRLNGNLIHENDLNVYSNTKTSTSYLSPVASVVIATTKSYEQIGGAWFEVITKPDVVTKNQISSFGNVSGLGWVTSYTKTLQSSGETTEQWNYVDRMNLLKRTRIVESNATGFKESLIRNGVLESAMYPGNTGAPDFIYTYDALGRNVKIKDNSGVRETNLMYDNTYCDLIASETLTYAYGGQTQSLTRSNTYYPYNHRSSGRLATSINNGTTTNYSYTNRGETAHMWGSTYPIQYKYDNQGRLESLHTYRIAPSELSSETWPDGDITQSLYYEGTEAIWKKVDTAQKAIVYEYDLNGHLDRRTFASGKITNYDFDWVGAPTKIDYADSTPDIIWSAPNIRGKYTQKQDAAGTHTLQFDSKGKLISDTISGLGVLTGTQLLQPRGAFGRLEANEVKINGVSQMIQSYSYDSLTGRLATIGDSGGGLLSTYTYLGYAGSEVYRVATGQSGGQSFHQNKNRDNLNRIQSVGTSDTTASVTYDSHVYSYNLRNLREREMKQGGSSWNYTYNERNEVVSAVHKEPNGMDSLGWKYSVTFDAIGNRSESVVNGQTASYTVNGLNQYTSREVPGVFELVGEAAEDATVSVGGIPAIRQGKRYFSQRSVDNSSTPQVASAQVKAIKNGGGFPTVDRYRILPGSFVPNTQFLSKNPETFTYDDDGNLTGDGRWMYTWDSENRLIAIETNAAAATAFGNYYDESPIKTRLEFAYDGMNRRIQKVVKRQTNGIWVQIYVRRYIYDGWNLIAELNGANNQLIAKYAWGLDISSSLQGGGGVGGLVFASFYQLNSWQSVMPFYDGSGNVRGLIRTSDANIVARYEYGIAGELLAMEGSLAAVNPIRFSSKYADDETQLVYYGRRYLNPRVSRWLNRDPKGVSGGINLYTMATNDLLNNYDYIGLKGANVNVFGTNIGRVSFPIYETHRNDVTGKAGVRIEGGFNASRDTGCLCEQIRWIQVVHSNIQSGNWGEYSFIDPPYDMASDNEPFYEDTYADGSIEVVGNNSFDIPFYDRPVYNFGDLSRKNPSIEWRAELGLVCVNRAQKTIQLLYFTKWGFDLTRKYTNVSGIFGTNTRIDHAVTLAPMGGSGPSARFKSLIKTWGYGWSYLD